MRLKNKVAIVTGASRGIGRAIAIALAKEGADVVVNCLNSETKAQEMVNEIKKLGRNGLVVRADVSKKEDLKKLAGQAVKTFGKIDILSHIKVSIVQ